MSSIEDFYIDKNEKQLLVYYVGNYKGFVTELGVSTANPGGLLSAFNGESFLKNTPLPLPAFSEGRSIGPLQKNKLLILFNNEKALTLNLNTLK